jgi:putative iron-regulated protein
VAAALLLVLVGGCKVEEEPYDAAVRKAASAYADFAYESHRDTAKELDLMLEDLDLFYEAPDSQKYNKVKVQWSVARQRWSQTEVFVVEGSPGADTYPLINLSRLDPSYIDYTTVDAGAGLVNDTDKYPNLSKELLTDAHQLEGPAHVTVGFHAIEYLLWGQDYDLESPGKRPFSDYDTGPDGTRDNQQRRRQYLHMASELLIDDIKSVRDSWKADEGDWRKEFGKLERDEKLRRMVVALARFSIDELEKGRLGEPLMLAEQHNDHSPFSDQSHEEFLPDALAIQNIYLGRYDDDLLDEDAPEEGPGLHSIVALKASALDEQFRTDLEATVEAARAVADGPPLEQALLKGVGSPERAAAENLLTALQAQNATLEEIANLFGFSLSGGDGGTDTGDETDTGTTDTGTTDTGTTDTGTTDTGTTDTGTDTGTDTAGTVFVPGPDMG